ANPNASIEGQALQTLLNVLTASQSPDMLQAQAFLLRRLALEGDVVPSRLPAPLNISEMGGYVNLLGTFGLTDARSQMLASALGIAGPSPALGTLGEQPPIAWLTLPNDRPTGPQQGSISLSIQVRADFAPALQAAIQALHDQGCALPLASPLQVLPPATAAAPTDLLPLIGRTIRLAPGQALVNPDADALAVAQLTAGPTWQVVSRVASAGPIPVAPQAWSAQACTPSACTVSPPPAAGREFVPLSPVLANAGFVQTTPGAAPANALDYGWSRFDNLTGLVPGVTTYGAELALLWPQAVIAGSSVVNLLGLTWNGTAFA
ncbi:MAG TPA: hypothetical protein VGF50_09445, partial [Caulobacteraceae bacterium]